MPTMMTNLMSKQEVKFQYGGLSFSQIKSSNDSPWTEVGHRNLVFRKTWKILNECGQRMRKRK